MLRRYFESIFRFFTGSSGETVDSSKRYAESGIPGPAYNLEAVSKKDAIYGTGNQWGVVSNKVLMNSSSKRFTESQENMVDSKTGIFKTVDVAVHRGDNNFDTAQHTR
jgi:hypothetical protein